MSSKIWFLIGALLASIVFIVLNKYITYFDRNSGFYILSSITQGLAALLAIILTAILIIVQIFRRFSVWRIAMSFETISLIVIYSISIVLPLIFLRIEIQAWMLNLSIGLIFLCIVVLIPFLGHIGSLFVNPVALGELEQDILEARDKGAWGKVSGLLQDFGYSWLRVISSEKQLEMEEYYDAWHNIRNHIASASRVQPSFLSVVFQITRGAIHKKQDEYAVRVYSSYHLPNEQLLKIYPLFKTFSLKLLTMACKKKLLKIKEYIILRLRSYSYRMYLKETPNDKGKESKAMIIDLLQIAPQATVDIFKRPLGNKTERELFIELLKDVETATNAKK